MKLHYSVTAMLLASASLFAQEEVKKGWTHSGLYSLSMSQTTLSNWNAGGNNSITVGALWRQSAEYNHNKFTWSNILEANFAINKQSELLVKTDDKLEFTTRVDYAVNEKKTWTGSFFGNFRTQFAKGYKNAGDADSLYISDFMAPGYATIGLGFTYKRDGFTAYLSPATSKMTFVRDQKLADLGSFGVDGADIDPVTGLRIAGTGKNFRGELGAYVNLRYTKALLPNLDVDSKLDLFSNYLDRPQNIDINWETIFLLKAYKSLTVSLHLHVIYDNDIMVQKPDADGNFTAPGTQFKEVLGVGLSYAFGKFKS